MPELKDAGDCVEVEGEERGPDVAAMFEFPPLESRREDSNGGSDSARALEIGWANALLSGRETDWLGGEAGVLTVGAGVEPLEEGEDVVTGEDIAYKLLFVVRILNERDDTHALKNNWQKKDKRKSTLHVGLLLQKSLIKTKDAKWTAPQTTAQTLDEELADPSRVQSYHKPCEPALMGLTAGCPLSSGCLTAKLVDRLTA